MANTASDVQGREEFWRPPIEARTATPAAQDVCSQCGTEFVVGSRFCHVCGGEREPRISGSRWSWTRHLDIRRLQQELGLPLGSLIAFIVGVICALAAIGTGLIFTATTVLDWQAVQIWRIEWLLAAVVAFLAGILLKRARTTDHTEDS